MKQKKCRNCGKEFTPQHSSLEIACSFECAKEGRKPDLKLKAVYKIPKVSKKRQVEQLQYQVLRTEFLSKPENKICPITNLPTNDIHHKKGRVGTLFLNTEFWIALSREGHKFVEENPKWAKENGYSLNRLSND
jgi:hypothetical protein